MNNLGELIAQSLQGGYTLGICAKIVDDQGRILLVRRSGDDTSAGVREMPGGALEKEETLEEGVRREVEEETGLTVKEIRGYSGYFDFHNIETGKKRRKFCLEVVVSGQLALSSDHSEAKRFTPTEINALVVEGETESYEIFRDHRNVLVQSGKSKV